MANDLSHPIICGLIWGFVTASGISNVSKCRPGFYISAGPHLEARRRKFGMESKRSLRVAPLRVGLRLVSHADGILKPLHGIISAQFAEDRSLLHPFRHKAGEGRVRIWLVEFRILSSPSELLIPVIKL